MPPPNNILANFALFIVSCTTPLATLNPFHPPSEGPPCGIGTKSGQGRTNQSSLETMISLKVDGGTYSTFELHIPPSNATQGEEILRGNDGSSGNTTHHLIFYHYVQEERRRSRSVKKRRSQYHDSSHQPGPASPTKSKAEV